MLLKACAGEEMLWASLTASQKNTTANTPLYLFIWEGNFQSYCGVFLFKEVTSFHQSHRESLTCMGLSNKVSEPTGLGELLQSNESKQHDSRVGLRALEREERGDRKKWSSVCVLHQFFFNANIQKQHTWSCKIIPTIVNSQGTCFHGWMLVTDSHVAVSLWSCFAENRNHCLLSRTNSPKNICLHIC